MSDRRRYSAGIRAALMDLSGGGCYMPDCVEPIVFWEGDTPIFNLEYAHIRALSRGGPRYDDGPYLPDEQRQDITNMLLLCGKHHKLVDKIEPSKYPASLLYEWKEEREASGRPRWVDIPERTEEMLQRAIRDQSERFSARVDDALERFEAIDSQAAAMLSGLVDEVATLRARGPLIDPDTAAMLVEAGRRLQHVDHELAASLQKTAQQLKFIGRDAEYLRLAANAASKAIQDGQRFM